MLVLAAIILVAGALALVLSPLARGAGAPLSDGAGRMDALRELYTLRDVTYETLRDLEYDFHAGKIDPPDYRDLSERYKQEAVAILERIDALEAPPGAAATRARD